MGTLRFLLALAVLVYHMSYFKCFGLPLADAMVGPISGKPAVETFFIISGFAMAGALATRYRDSSTGGFYLSRVLRLYPAYLLILALELVAATVLWSPALPHAGNLWARDAAQPFAERLLWTWTNVGILGKEAWFMNDGQLRQFVSPAWSLSIELQFYLLAPFLVKWPIRRLVALFLAVAVYRALLIAHHGAEPMAYFSLPWQLCLFLLGILSYRVIGHWQAMPARRALWPAMAVMLLTVMFPHYSDGDGQNDWIKLGYWLLLFWTLPALSRIAEASGIDAFLGDLSYPLYLVNLGLIYSVASLGPQPFGRPWLTSLITIAAALAVSVIVVQAIDRPMTLIRRRLAFQAKPTLAIA